MKFWKSRRQLVIVISFLCAIIYFTIYKSRPKILLPNYYYYYYQNIDEPRFESGFYGDHLEDKFYDAEHFPVTQGGEDPDPIVRQRRDKVKEMMKHSWENYVAYAWGDNELRPISQAPYYDSVFKTNHMAVTLIDAADTLYMMGMKTEFAQAKDWIAKNLDLDAMESPMSVFEVNIRIVAGLLACFSLTGDQIFHTKARDVADKLLTAFESPTGIPYTFINFNSNISWGSTASLSEFGSLSLEMAYLTDVTGNSVYRSKVDKITNLLKNIEKPKGLYPVFLDNQRGKWETDLVSVGAFGDSFYEYLLKIWLQSNKENTEARKMFDESMAAIFQHLLFTSKGGLMYLAQRRIDTTDEIINNMEHLTCFIGGLLALASKTLGNHLSTKYMDVAKGITQTCRVSYDRSYVKLGPERFGFNNINEAKALTPGDACYVLRPEVVESYFYMWRLTKDEKYRSWGWDVVQALEKYCKVPGGYTGIKNVYSNTTEGDDIQQSFFLSETLKYLYLLFSDDSLFSLDEWVFNTEGHPLPIKGVNVYYRQEI